jgi:hypothetical protein
MLLFFNVVYLLEQVKKDVPEERFDRTRESRGVFISNRPGTRGIPQKITPRMKYSEGAYFLVF